MSTVTKAISSVEFHVNARQANAALQSIQEEAKRCRLQVEELQEQAAKGVTTVKVDGMDVDIQKRIKEVKALQKTWESAAQSQIKGAKAFDELWKNARMGTIESMTGAQIKAGINGSKPIYDRLRLGDAEDRMKAQAIKDMQDQGQKVLNQLKTTTDQIIKQIADGETIAADVLEREARNLKSIMDLLPPLSQEWKDYNLQYQAVNQQIERQTVLERQLRGEIVTREDAIRVINAANREATQQEIAQEEQRAKAAREAAEAKASEADQYRATVEQKQSEIFATNDLIAAKRREIDAHHESAAAAKDAADKAREAAYKDRKQAEQEAREQQDAYNKQKKIRDDAAKDVEKFRKELEKLGEQDEKRAGVQQKLTDAETRLADEDRKLGAEQDKLTDKQTKATEAATKHKQAIQGVKDVMEENRKTGQRLGEEMGELTKQHKQQSEELADASEKMTDAEKESNRHIKTEQEARLRIQQLNNQSIEQLTASLRVLEEENRRINDPGNQQWQENERYIGQLNLRLEELKKQSADLRREPVLDMMTQRMDQLGTLSRDALTETKKFWQAMYDGAENDADKLREIEDNLKRINTEEQKRDRKTLEERAARLQQVENYSVGELREGIEAAKRLQDQYHLTDDELQQLSVNIVAAETRIAKVGVEAERQAQKQREQIDLMQQQLANGSALTESALKAQASYWQRLADDPKAAAEAVKQYTANMERAQSLLDVKERVDIRMKAGRLDNMDGYSVSELREGIDAAKKMQDTFRLSNDEVQQLSEKIVAAEVRISQFSVESERQAQRQREQIALMEQQLANGSALTESALKAQVSYWQRLADDPKAAAEAVAQYTANMKQAQDLLDQSQRADIESKAGRLQNLGAYSISEIREGIDAAKKMQQTFHLTDAEVQELSEDIVAAEKHVSQFSVENERAAQKQREQIELMEEQLRRGTGLTETALKQQESYWRRLADDPKAAANEIARYFINLNKVHAIQKEQAESQTTAYGLNALKFFRGDTSNASADQIKEQAKALKAYRDSLPSKDKADVIAEIDGYLKAAGVSAKGAADDVMDLKDALDLAEKAGQWSKDGKGGFSASAQEIQAATKALELRREELIKQIRAERDLGNAVDAQEKELDDLTKKLRSLKFEQDNVNMSQEKMRTLIETPANAVNLDELRAAIKRADGQLRQMEQSLGQNSDEYKRFAEQVRQAKNVMKEMEGQAKASATAWEKAFSRLKTYVVMYMGFNEVWQKVSNTARDLMDLSDRMGEVRKTTGFTADEVGRLSENLKKMDVRTSLTSLMEISASAGQLGLKTLEDVQGFTEAANKLMIALPEMGREAATEMMRVAIATGEVDKIRKQLQEGTVEGSSATAVAMEKIASTIDRLRASSASTAPEITDFVKRVGAVGAQSGITIDQVAALGSTVSSLGMRVEMSATALSRMIPAIRNNAYEIGAIIGKTEEDIKRRFAEGQGMTVIIDLFKAIRERSGITAEGIENDADGMADKVEKMLEAAGFQDVMKELNQQGARAGIVFAGLSQNVEQLEYQLGVASEAYEENIAIQQEFDRMNETTAAKWERLKNAFEEMFVGDDSQRFLGGIIDLLRGLVDFISGNVEGVLKGLRMAFLSVAAGVMAYRMELGKLFLVEGFGGLSKLWKLLVSMKDTIVLSTMYTGEYIAMKWKLIWATEAEEKATIRAKIAQLGLNKAMTANVFMAIAAAILTAYMALKDWIGGSKAASNAFSELSEKVDEEKRKLDILVNAYHDANGNLDKRKNLMNEINQKYSQYLGFLLTDAENSNLVALAHERIAAALQAEMYERERAQGESKVRQDFREDLSEDWKLFTDELRKYGLGAEQVAQARNDIQGFLSTVSYDAAEKDFVFAEGTKEGIIDYMRRQKGATGANLSDADANEIIAIWVNQYLEQTFGLDQLKLRNITGVGLVRGGKGWANDRGGDNFRGDYADTYVDMLEQIGIYNDDVNGAIAAANTKMKENRDKIIPELKKQAETAIGTIQNNLNATDEEIATAYENLASAIDGLEKISAELPQIAEKEGQTTSGDISSFIMGWFTNNPRVDTQKVNDARTRLASVWNRINQQRNGSNGDGDGDGGGDNPRGPYGNYDKRVDPYEQWDANALVKRREEMLERVRALAGGADVQKVLSMDKRFMDEATRKGIKNMRDAIAWYNEERLKIQEELHDRNLTNEGQWADPKKGRSKKPKTPESEEAIAELDRYYLERKERIEEARANEEVTEAEYNRRLDALEQEHLVKRSELRQTFTSNDKQFIQQFRQWWASVAELDEVSWETIEAEWIAAFDRDRKYNNRAAQKDLTQMQAITVKQLKEIEAIIDKERPFNGITTNLQDNLTKMGLLFKDGAPEGKAFMEQNTKRLTFLLKEAEDAYNMTWEQLERDMRENGLGSWADAIVGGDNAEKEKRAIIAQLHEVYDAVQDAVKKEASLVKKQVDIAWNDAILPNGKSLKATYEQAISAMGVEEGRVSRANNLIGAGAASARVADRLAIKQMQVQLAMQEHYYNLIRKQGQQRIDDLRREAQLKREAGLIDDAEQLDLDAKHATMSLNLSLAKEETELAKQREEIIARTEESQNRLYTELRSWADLLTSSLQGVMEASHAGDAEYYNERAKLDLTGKGGPGAGTYVVIDDAGTSDATAHYEYLDERQALERQHEIEVQNAQAEAWRKLMDDINMKMSEQITDWINASLQQQAVAENTAALKLNTDAEQRHLEVVSDENGIVEYNTDAVRSNTGALQALTQQLAQGITIRPATDGGAGSQQGGTTGTPAATTSPTGTAAPVSTEATTEGSSDSVVFLPGVTPGVSWQLTEEQMAAEQAQLDQRVEMQREAAEKVRIANEAAFQSAARAQKDSGNQMVKSSQSSFAKMTMAANLYGIAYQAMSNDNLSTTQKFQMMAVQAAGNAAISMLTTEMASASAKAATDTPGVLGTLWKQLGWAAAPVFAIFTGLLGGLMGLATSKIGKAKSEIAQATGASVGAGRLATGMLTYAEGNVNELTDPASLTPGRQYNVDGADGKTYRARYMGKGAKTHITNGPEFHLVGEAGREAIIDAKTTRLLQMNETGIWRDIQTLYNGGSISGLSTRRRRGGVAAFAEGNIGEFEDALGGEAPSTVAGGMSAEVMIASLDRNSAIQEALLERLNQPIYAQNILYGPDGLPNIINKLNKEAQRHGEKYL